MESFTGSLSAAPQLEEPVSQARDPPHLPHFRIPPLREPVPSRAFKVPSPLEPSAGSLSEPNIAKPHHPPNGNPPTELPTLADFLNAARSDKVARYAADTPSSLEPPPKPILPFINLRTVENLPYPFDEETPRKHARLDTQADGFGEHLHLPVPKIHKETSKPRPFGPLAILNGLNEPPPNAALFPPIETDSTPTILTRPSRDTVGQTAPSEDGTRQKIREIIEPTVQESADEARTDQPQGVRAIEHQDVLTSANSQQTYKSNERQSDFLSSKSGSRKRIRKWSESETLDLLRGVVRCGVGNWTAILSQPDLDFSNRTAANLKDRFRVCCPWAYESEKMAPEDVKTRIVDAVSKSGSELAGKIFLPDPRTDKSCTESNAIAPKASETRPSENPITPVVERPNQNADDEAQKTNQNTKVNTTSRGSQALSHKSQLTLVSLGLPNPQISVKSKRRLRRPFTAEEDQALLEGYTKHGFQWTLIQQDEQLGLMHRKATVLRDRFRTRFPEAYKTGGAATIMVEDPGRDMTTSQRPSQTAQEEPQSENSIKNPTARPSNTDISSRSHKRTQSSRTMSNDTLGGTTATPVDPAMLPPAPPSNLSDFSKPSSNPIFTFSIDENSSGTAEAATDTRWADNSSPPPVWEDTG